MGQSASAYLLPHLWRQDEPDTFTPIKYDPQFGFDGERREKAKYSATVAEMDSANLEPRVRDNCAHLRIAYRGCVKDYAPIWGRCKGLMNELSHCYLDEYVHDMKEFEREKRLNARERRLREQAA